MEDNTFVFLVQKEEMWARMLVEVLEDNNVPCATRPVLGVGFAMKMGVQDYLQIFVPPECFEQANALAEELFADDTPVTDEFFEDEEDFE